MRELRVILQPVNLALPPRDIKLIREGLSKIFEEAQIVLKPMILPWGRVHPYTFTVRPYCEHWKKFCKKYGGGYYISDPDELYEALTHARKEDPELFRKILNCLLQPLCSAHPFIADLIELAKKREAILVFLEPHQITPSQVGTCFYVEGVFNIHLYFEGSPSYKLFILSHEIGHYILKYDCDNPDCIMHPCTKDFYDSGHPLKFCSSCLEKLKRWSMKGEDG